MLATPPVQSSQAALRLTPRAGSTALAAAITASSSPARVAVITASSISGSFALSPMSMADTNCTRWRRKTVPVWLIEKGAHAPGLVRLVCCAL